MMKWEKLGVVVKPDGTWPLRCAQYPAVYPDAGVYRVYFTDRDPDNRSRAGWAAVPAAGGVVRPGANLMPGPFLEHGPAGSFDDNGAVFCCKAGGYTYYLGWQQQGDTFHSSLGVSGKGRVFGPAEGSPDHVVGPVWVLEGDPWRLWYAQGRHEHEAFHAAIRYAESPDGLSWEDKGVVLADDEAAVRPVVRAVPGGYEMFYSTRKARGFRHDRRRSYRARHAVSPDGVRWEGMGPLGLEPSESGWDSGMVCYPCPVDDYVFYCGNDFGGSGIGVAKRVW